jgi:hypothetical protein
VNYEYVKSPPPPPLGEEEEEEEDNNSNSEEEKDNYYYEDVSDGKNYNKHMEEMNKNFRIHQSKHTNSLIKINLLISQFYDGIQIYHKKYKSFWPLMITILNLPPSIRNKIGVGSFLITMFSGVQGTNAENHLLEKCFVEELQLLQKGLIIYCRNQYYFVQVRLIQHCVDTKALGKLLNVHETNSLEGCPFCRMKGTSRSLLNKVVYAGHRILLNDKHIVRYYGKSEVCCPPSYYAQEKVFIDECQAIEENNKHYFHRQYLKMKLNMESELVLESSEKLSKLLVYSGSCEVENKTQKQYEAIRKARNDFYNNQEIEYVWYHEHYEPLLFREYLQFVHCDLRKQMSNTRISNDQYVTNGLQAEELNRNKKVKKVYDVGGVKGLWPFYKLNYVDYKTDINFDPFHVFMDYAKLLMELLSNNVCPKTEQFCMQNNTHSFLWPKIEVVVENKKNNKKKKKMKKEIKVKKSPYNIPTKSEQNELEAWMNAILIPISHSKSFQINNILSEMGYLKGSAYIAIFTTTINYFNLALGVSVAQEYKDFFSMFGSDLTELLSISFSDKNIDYLEKQLIETICVHEAMFTEAECSFMTHEIIHLAPHIKQMGPLRGWWTYAGERAMNFVKKHIRTTGGQSFEKTTMRKYNSSESIITKQYYGKKLIDKESSIFIDKRSKKIFFDNFPCKLLKSLSGQNKPMKFSTHEMNFLLECLLNEVNKQCIDSNEAGKRSTIFRIHTLFRTYKFPRKSEDNTFYNWILIVYDLIMQSTESTRVSSRLKFGDDLSEHYADAGNILTQRTDFLELKDTVVSLVELYKNIEIYLDAIIYGQRFSGRGFHFSELFAPTQEYVYGRESKLRGFRPKKECNHLSKYENWKFKRQYSSWCRFQNFLNKRRNNNSSNYGYGQINYFFRIKCPRDKILHGLPLANIVYRTYTTLNKVDYIDCTEFGSMNSAKHPSFVPLTNIYASPILIAPFDSQRKPIIINKKRFKPDTVQYCSKSNIVDHAYLFDLFPYQSKHILYDRLKNYNIFEEAKKN